MLYKPSDGSLSLYLRLLSYVRPYRKVFGLSIFGLVIVALTEPYISYLFKPMLDGSFVEKDSSTLVWVPLALVGAYAVRGLFGYIGTNAMNWVAARLVYDLRMLMFDRLLSLPTERYDHEAGGTLVSKLIYDVTQVTQAATDVVIILVRDSVTIIGLLAWLFYLDWQLTLITFVTIPPIILLIQVINKRLRGIARALQSGFGNMTQILDETIGGHREVKIFGAQSYENERFDKVSNNVRQLQFKAKLAATATPPIAQLLVAIGLAVIVYIASGMGQAGELTVGGFVSYITAMAMLFSPIKRITSINERLQRGLAASESIFALLDTEPEADDGKPLQQTLQGHILFENVSFKYQHAHTTTLKNFNLEIQPGQTIALVGPTGSGKSTVASLLPRFYEIESGAIHIDGHDITDVRRADLRNQLAIVSQTVTLFNDSIRANVAYGCAHQPSDDEIMAAIKAADLEAFIASQPDGLDTMVGDDGVRLSGGQRQRIAIARALLKDAPILILDEATSALDNESERRVQQAIDRLRAQRTTLVIAHRLSTIEAADQILVLQHGETIEQGTHQNLIEKGGLYAELHKAQFKTQDSDS